jgi:hypothetical protein
MSKFKSSQNGFSLMRGVIVAVVVVVVLVLGYQLLNINKGKNESTKTADKSSGQTTGQKQQYLEIKEKGIKFKPSEGIKDAYYVASNDGNIHFSVRSIDGNEELAHCAVIKDDSTRSGIVALVSGKPGEDIGTPEEGAWTVETLEQKGMKKVGDTYYGFQRGNGACFDTASPNAQKNADKVSDIAEEFIRSSSTFTKL